MDRQLRNLAGHYATLLREYLALEQETALQKAYELGRKSISLGVGVLDMTRIHHDCLALCMGPEKVQNVSGERLLKSAEAFFMEALSPFEAAHRGFREANERLKQLNAALAQRNAELDTMNRQLERSEDHHRRLLREARIMQESLRQLSSRILHVQEEERKRISRELHDEVGQALTAVQLNLAVLASEHTAAEEGSRPVAASAAASAGFVAGAMGNRLAVLPAASETKSKITDSRRIVEHAMNTVHGFARELRPAMLDELGLTPALRSYLKEYAGRTGLRVRFQGAGEDRLNNEQKTVLFRVAQESLTNVARHARASCVGVVLRARTRGVTLRIRDDGRGFNAEWDRSRRLGLLGMEERVRLVNGSFRIESKPGGGTSVIVDIPFQAEPDSALPERLGGRGAPP